MIGENGPSHLLTGDELRAGEPEIARTGPGKRACMEYPLASKEVR